MTLLEKLNKHYAWAQELGIKGQAVCFNIEREEELKLVYDFSLAAYRPRIRYLEFDNEGKIEIDFCHFDYDIKE